MPSYNTNRHVLDIGRNMPILYIFFLHWDVANSRQNFKTHVNDWTANFRKHNRHAGVRTYSASFAFQRYAPIHWRGRHESDQVNSK